MLYFKVISSSSAAVNATIDTNGGFLYGTFNVNLKTGAVSNGKVTDPLPCPRQERAEHLGASKSRTTVKDVAPKVP